MSTMTRFRQWLAQLGDAALRLTGLDDASMDIEEARLRCELGRLEAIVDSQGEVSDARRAHALRKAQAALRDAERRRP